MTSRWNIEVDRSRCEATGMCEGAAPEYFALDDEGKARPLGAVVAASETVLMAANCCPSEAITITDHDSGERIAPAE